MENIKEEYLPIIDEICEKYEYNTEDKPGNKSLGTILKEITPIMLEGRSLEDRELFYDMLRNTPIEIIDTANSENVNYLHNKHYGDINKNVIEEKNVSAYNRRVAPGAYSTKPIIDDDMKIVRKKIFYISYKTI
ncbi:MAG: hypothetical protein IKG42_05140 [Clostridia bacterium]|nr:hypothetical protein [Clostridia bacterium]